jgi:phosphoribosylformylglycinamidine synthase
MELKVGSLVRDAIAQGLLGSAHDCSDGGLAVALAESCIASGLGIEIDLVAHGVRLDRVLFAEGGSRVVVSVKGDQVGQWEDLLKANHDLPITQLGVVTEHPHLLIRVDQEPRLNLDVEQCRLAYTSALPRRIDADGQVGE